MKLWQLVILMTILLASGISIGWGLREKKIDQYYMEYKGALTKQETIALLVSYRYNHQYFVDNPDKIEPMTGSVVDNQRLVENYTKIINYVETAR